MGRGKNRTEPAQLGPEGGALLVARGGARDGSTILAINKATT